MEVNRLILGPVIARAVAYLVATRQDLRKEVYDLEWYNVVGYADLSESEREFVQENAWDLAEDAQAHLDTMVELWLEDSMDLPSMFAIADGIPQ